MNPQLERSRLIRAQAQHGILTQLTKIRSLFAILFLMASAITVSDYAFATVGINRARRHRIGGGV